MRALDHQFIGEARDLLEQIGGSFLALEKTPSDSEKVRILFRQVHTLKGASGIFDRLAPLTRSLHAAEDVLDQVRAGEIALTPDLTDIFLETFDQVLEWIDAFEANGSLNADADSTADRMAQAIRAAGTQAPQTGETSATSSALNQTAGPLPDRNGTVVACAPPVPEAPLWLRDMAHGEHADTVAQARSAVTYRPHADVFFQGDDPVRTARTAPDVVWFEVCPASPWPAPDAFDPFVCNLEFHLLSSADTETLKAHFHYVERQCTFTDLPLATPEQAAPEASSAPVTAQNTEPFVVPEGVADLLEELATGLGVAGDDNIAAGRVASTERILAALENAGVTGLLGDGAVRDAVAANDPAALSEALIDLSSLVGQTAPAVAGTDTLTSATPTSSAPPTSSPPLSLSEATSADNPAASGSSAAPGTTDHPERPDAAAAEGRVDGTRRSTSIKVDQNRLDDLMDMVGELVVVKNGLPFLARSAEEDHGNKALSRQIRAQYDSLNRVTNALQGSVMRMRMIPVGVVFSRFNRQVRDIARRLGKDISLSLVGEDTEADKTVVEELADPLVHLIRNACDHGLETAEERQAAGKPAQGLLTLTARSEDDHVVIELRDDGWGIDGAAIRRKALEKGLIDEDRAQTLSDGEAINLILMPGFSMAHEVSDLSGRGVGMDVVKTMVERRGGRLDIRSTVGVGTTVRLSVPLSMALTRVMLFDVGGQQFGVPLAVISETRRVPASDIHRVKNQECIVYRDRVVTLKRLARVLELDEPPVDEKAVVTDPAVLVLDVDGREVGLVVDRFHEGMDLVVKPMDGVLSAFPIYAGTALLGDGRVLPVFNVKELIKCL